ncbi:LAFE_0E09208g1_1 [Lachancea fermentati]|uniref:LAFE_0E09208g1_1 n=1 Tax=Lachancea fermentati TaxID=4955 RepID=A0A1G4MDM9_LACFM|nr:LAFE_0E09208g1_1 [Lachancea fermentati]
MSNFGRKTWNREEYAQLEREGKGNQASTLDSLSEQQLETLKAKFSDHNALIKNAMLDSNKRTLTTGLNAYKAGRQYGFYCDICDMTFKDTLQYVNHLNHKIHQIKFDQVFDEPLILDTRDNDELTTQEFEQSYAESLKVFLKVQNISDKAPKKRINRTKDGNEVQLSSHSHTEPPNELNEVMGFVGFGSTKK